MGRIKEMLEGRGYNLRERANIYAGLTLGALAPIAATRYLIFSGIRTEEGLPLINNLFGEAVAWTVSTIANVGCSLFAEGIPLAYTAGMGGIAGGFSAEQLKRKRLDKTRCALEGVLQTD